MRYLDLPTSSEHPLKRELLTRKMMQLCLQTGRSLMLPLETIHLAMWLFHAQILIADYPNFDRFVYLMGCLFLAGKLTENIMEPLNLVKAFRKILKAKKSKIKLAEDS